LKSKIENKLGSFQAKNYFFGRVGVGVGWVGVGGWVEKLRIRLSLAQFQLKLPVGAELGKNESK
jgi:hypothetical protein